MRRALLLWALGFRQLSSCKVQLLSDFCSLLVIAYNCPHDPQHDRQLFFCKVQLSSDFVFLLFIVYNCPHDPHILGNYPPVKFNYYQTLFFTCHCLQLASLPPHTIVIWHQIVNLKIAWKFKKTTLGSNFGSNKDKKTEKPSVKSMQRQSLAILFRSPKSMKQMLVNTSLTLGLSNTRITVTNT